MPVRRILPTEEIPVQVRDRTEEWRRQRLDFDPAEHASALVYIFSAIGQVKEDDWDDQSSLRFILSQVPKDGSGFYSKSNLVAGYRWMVEQGDLDEDPDLLRRIRMKPMRTASGVAPVTVLTAPAGCPSACIFCPDDVRMPKSYIHDEPGCQRAEQDGFDPFRQTLGRIQGFESIGHTADKVELLILGGTWSAYSREYRNWYVQRCLDAMNCGDGSHHAQSPSLAVALERNVSARHRNVGLVVETRPDWITPDEIRHLRSLGVTKVQIGVQSLDDRILELNNRGHTVAEVRRALDLLRTAGFKLHLHWMPNLHGATPESDRRDFRRFFSDRSICPDEMKIYPCSLIAGTELHRLWQQGLYRPYTETELVDLLADVKPTIPPYTRINRLFRDIPAHHIQAGVRTSNLREVVQRELARRGTPCGCIRCREISQAQVDPDRLSIETTRYRTTLTEEFFIACTTPDPEPDRSARLVGFLRLSHIREPGTGSHAFLDELCGAAMIREVHVYGMAQGLGRGRAGAAQHAGVGHRLLNEAARLSADCGYDRQSVIAATGTRGYYAARGFRQGELYMHRDLN